MDSMLTVMQVAALSICGMYFALLGAVKLPLARRLEIDEVRVGGLVSVFGFTLIPMVLAAGFLVDVWGKQVVLAGGFLLAVASLLALGRLRNYTLVVVAVLVLGTGWSAQVNVLNVTSPPAFVPQEELPERMAYAMNMGDFIFGMGTFLTPLLMVYMIRTFGLVRAFYVLAAVSIIPVILGLGVDWEQLRAESTDTVMGGIGKLLSDPVVWFCCLAFFFHVPTEASIAAWATTLATKNGVTETTASTLLSVFWLTFMGSRLVTAFALPEGIGSASMLVIAMSVFSIALTLAIVFSRSAWLTCLLIVIAGAVVGPIFPTLIALLVGHVGTSLQGRAVGVFFCIGGIGWTIVPILIGIYAERTSVQRAFLIPCVCAVVLTVLTVLLRLNLSV